MFILKTSKHHSKASEKTLQVFKLFENWGALSLQGNSTCAGFKYPDLGNLLEDLLKNEITYELYPGPTIRIFSYGTATHMSDYYSSTHLSKEIDQESQKILCLNDQNERIINLVYQGDKYLLIDANTGVVITLLSELKSLERDLLELCQKYKV